MNLSLLRVEDQLDRVVRQPGPRWSWPTRPPTDARRSRAAIAATPGTGRSVVLAGTTANVPAARRLSHSSDMRATRAGSATTLIAGRWFTGPGEVVRPDRGLHAGPGWASATPSTLSSGGREVTVTARRRDLRHGRSGYATTSSCAVRFADLATLDPGAGPTSWEVLPTSATTPRAYADGARAGHRTGVLSRCAHDAEGIDEGVPPVPRRSSAFMGIVLVAISLGGVFNTVLLETRQRMREMAILKALGLTPPQVIVMVVASIVPVGLRRRSGRGPARARVPAGGPGLHGPGRGRTRDPRADLRRVRAGR